MDNILDAILALLIETVETTIKWRCPHLTIRLPQSLIPDWEPIDKYTITVIGHHKDYKPAADPILHLYLDEEEYLFKITYTIGPESIHSATTHNWNPPIPRIIIYRFYEYENPNIMEILSNHIITCYMQYYEELIIRPTKQNCILKLPTNKITLTTLYTTPQHTRTLELQQDKIYGLWLPRQHLANPTPTTITCIKPTGEAAFNTLIAPLIKPITPFQRRIKATH